MVDWHVAESLLQLTSEINKKYGAPFWPTVSIGDGAVGDTSHQARKSDHNPCWLCEGKSKGVIRAVDIGISGRNAREILNEVIGDRRVWYVIHRGKIYSRTHGWVALRYTGNPHDEHIHVSIQGANGITAARALRIETDTSKWWEPKKPRTTATIDFSNVRNQFIAAIENPKLVEWHGGVEIIQRNLNRKYDAGLKVDGLVGGQTVVFYRHHEREVGESGRPGVPDMVTLKKLVPLSVKIRK